MVSDPVVEITVFTDPACPFAFSAEPARQRLRWHYGERRYSAPSYELRRVDGTASFSVPGFNAVEAYEAAIANLAPELERRPKPESVRALLAWAGEPLASAEVVEVTQLDDPEARAALSRVARATPAGADAYWTLDGAG
jgi:hypothetical protein